MPTKKQPDKVANPEQRLGTGGTPVYGGYVYSVEKNPMLNGNNRYKTYSDMFSNISIVASGVRYFLNVISKSAWKVEPSDADNAQSVEYAKKTQDIINNMQTPFHRVVRKAVMYKFYGFSVQEWTAAKQDDGSIGFLDIEARPQKTIERWDCDDAGIVNGVYQRSPQLGTEIYLPRPKLVYIVDDSLSDSPEGFGLFRHIVEASQRLQRYEQLEGFGYETDLRGVPVGRAPIAQLQEMVKNGTLTQDDMDKILAPIKTFLSNHIKGPKLGMLLDSMSYQSTNEATTPSQVKQWDIGLLETQTDSLKDISAAIARVNGEIARTLGVEGLLLGSGKGSQALSRDKSDNFFMVVDGTLKEVSDSYNRDVIGALWTLNGWDPKLKPKFKPDSIQLRDVERITGALKDMAAAGAVLAPDDPAIDEVRDLLGLSKATINDMAQDASLSGKPTTSSEELDDKEGK